MAKEKEKRGFYKQFTNARLSEETQEWLKEENRKYGSWEKLFKELIKRYAENKNRPESLPEAKNKGN